MAAEHPVLARLLSSNAQWAQDVKQAEPDFFREHAKSQHPKVLWFGCSDSRVPESVLMACRPGEVFVHRNIANQFHPNDDSAISVLTYAVENVGVEHVIVVGHTQCGGAAACFAHACSPPPTPPPSTPLNRWLTPLIKLTTSLKLTSTPPAEALRRIVEENVRVQVKNVAATEVLREAWGGGKKVWVHGWVYDLETGTLNDLGVTVAPH